MFLERDQADYEPTTPVIDFQGFYVRNGEGNCVGWLKVLANGEVLLYAMLDSMDWQFIMMCDSKDDALAYFTGVESSINQASSLWS